MAGYAIIETGSKQYRVQEGDVIDVELLGTVQGESAHFTKVLLFHDGISARVGTPSVSDALVQGEVVGEVRGPKRVAYKYKKRKNYRRKVGHRQDYTRVRITRLVCTAPPSDATEEKSSGS